MRETITVKGARENNLRNVDVEIPRNALVVLTGLSGSGKSSLAFETIYAEGQRRFLESLSAYSRKFVAQLKKPAVDFVYGLSPVISIEQKSVSKNPRSTVGTMTDIYDYLRVLYATSGVPHCPHCGSEVPVKSAVQIAERILSLPPGTVWNWTRRSTSCGNTSTTTPRTTIRRSRSRRCWNRRGTRRRSWRRRGTPRAASTRRSS